MEYTVNELAQLSGVSGRTLRYYDSIDLLKPARIACNGYRIYGQEQVDRLQQILFYRALEVPLEEIKQMLDDRHFDRYTALQQHLQVLTEKKTRLEGLIATIEKTIRAMEGEYPMKDKEKFEGLKQQVLAENRAKYGKELDEKYGAVQMAASEEKVANMSQEQWNAQKAEEWEIASLLKEAMELGDPACVQAQRACDLHRPVALPGLAGRHLYQGCSSDDGGDVRGGRTVPSLLRSHRPRLCGIFPRCAEPLLCIKIAGRENPNPR